MLVPHASIRVGDNRQRRDFEASSLEELRTSIQETPYGLQHPLVVRRSPEGDGYLLVAGERRLRAISDIYSLGGTFRHAGDGVPPGMVPVTDLGDLDPLDAFEAELEENIRRRDLTIIERAQATAQLLDLRTKQATRDQRLAPTRQDVARELFDLPATEPAHAQAAVVRDHLIIARHADDADVQKATSVKEAVKIVKKKEEARRHTELAKVAGAAWSASDLRMLNVDAETWCAAAPAGQFDIILTDPPYGMGADSFGDSGVGTSAAAHYYEDTPEKLVDIIGWFAPESFRLAKPDAHLYLFCDFDWFGTWTTALIEAGWNVFRTPLIWHNPDGYRAPWPDSGPQRKYECILYAKKGQKRCTSVRPDVIEARKDAATGHPAQKPIGLLLELLRRSAAPGDAVFDPFAGSGSTLLAAANLRLPATGLEQLPQAYGIAVERLATLSKAPV